MDAIRMLERMGEVPPADDAAVDAAVQVVLSAALREKSPSHLDTAITEPPRHRSAVGAGAMVVASAAAVLAVVALLPVGGTGSPSVPPTGSGSHHGTPSALTAQRVRLISTLSAAAAADSGTAVETTADTIGSTVQGTPGTIDVTFSGQNVNYLVVDNGNGAAGVENRVVDGQLYLYIKGPDLQMHWYHDTSPNAGSSLQFPDPRTLLQAVSPAAGLVDLGHELVGGINLLHLRATTPGLIGKLGIPDVNATVTSFDVWIDSADIVRQMVVSSSTSGYACLVAPPDSSASKAPGTTMTIPPSARSSTLPSGKPVPPGTVCGLTKSTRLGSTLRILFANLGAPETVSAPSDAVDQPGLG